MLKEDILLVVDPRFPGGTSTAFAAEIDALKQNYTVAVCYTRASMFKGRPDNPAVLEAVERHKLPVYENQRPLSCRNIVLHNPVFLKFDSSFNQRFACQNLFVICHENLCTPQGDWGFNAAACFHLIERATIAQNYYIAPISPGNREGVEHAIHFLDRRWQILKFDWFNKCHFELLPPTQSPSDRRGRHSRPGHEKFPNTSAMAKLFPPHAQYCGILGSDSLGETFEQQSNVELLPFGTMAVAQFLQKFDFFIYYVNPMWQESFGRVLAEATAAGKLVITEHRLAKTFNNTVASAEIDDVDQLIEHYVNNPSAYQAQVIKAQSYLHNFSDASFLSKLNGVIA